jgi:uncharacterized protein (TIGR00369 family)
VAGLSVEELNGFAKEAFSAWVLDLDMTVVEASEQHVKVKMVPSERLKRIGDIVSGQALMAAADSVMVLTIFSACGEFVKSATVDMNSSFLKPATTGDLYVSGSIVRKGRSIVFARAEIVSSRDGKPVLSATGTYALPPPAKS